MTRDAAEGGLDLCLLGGIELRGVAPGDADALLAQSKPVALLACLALSPDGPFQRRDWLAGLLWPDLDQSHARAAAFRAKEAARLALLPTISFALDGGRLTDRVLELLHLNPWLVHGAIGAAVPIYEGGALRADIKIATAEQEEASARYGSVVLRAFGEVETALTNERLLAQQTQSDQRALDDRIATTKYNVGTIDLLYVEEGA